MIRAFFSANRGKAPHLLTQMLWTLLWLGLWLSIWVIRHQHPEMLTLESLAVTHAGGALIAASLLLFFAAYFKAHCFSLPLILSMHVLAALILIDTPPLLSSDVYLYAARGRLLSFYGLNPYIYPPNTIWFDPIIAHVYPGWLEHVQPYGPMWSSVSALLCRLAGNDIEKTVSSFQFLGFFGSLTCLWAVYQISVTRYREESKPSRLRRHFYLIAANPLLLIEAVNNAHNDIWMLSFVLLALQSVARRKYKLLLCYLVLASLIKAPALVLLPIALVFLFRLPSAERPSVLYTLGLPIFVAGLIIFPFTESLQTLDGMRLVTGIDRQFAAFLGTPIVFAYYLWRMSGYEIISAEGSLLLGRCLFIIAYIFLLLERKLGVHRKCELALSAVLAFASSVFLPWYAIWVLGISAAGGSFRSTLFWSVVGGAAYYFGYATAFVFLCALPFFALWIYTNRREF